MDDPETEQATKKLKELQQFIPFLETHINIGKGAIGAQSTKYDKLVQMRDILISNKRAKLPLLLKIESALQTIIEQIEKKASTGGNIKQVKQEKTNSDTIKMENDRIQSPESPPMFHDKKNADEPITIPTERKGGKSYSYENSKRTGSHRHSHDRDSDRYARDNRSDYYRSSSSHIRHHRDRRSRSIERKYDHRHGGTSGDYYKHSRDRDNDYERKNKPFGFKNEKRDDDNDDDDERRECSTSRYRNPCPAPDESDRKPSVSSFERPNKSVFGRLGTKIEDLDQKDTSKLLAKIEDMGLEDLDKCNEKRFGISEQNESLVNEMKAFDSIVAMQEKIRDSLVQKSHDEILAVIGTMKPASPIKKEQKNSPVQKNPKETLLLSPPMASTSAAVPTERIALKFNRKPRNSRIESNEPTSSSPSSTTINTFNVGGGPQDPRLKNRDPRAPINDAFNSKAPGTIFGAQPAPNLSHTFNSFSPMNISSTQMHSNMSPVATNPLPINSPFVRNINLNPNSGPTNYFNPVLRQHSANIYLEPQQPNQHFNPDYGNSSFNYNSPPSGAYDNQFHSKPYDQFEAYRRPKQTYAEHRRARRENEIAQAVSSTTSAAAVTAITITSTTTTSTTITTKSTTMPITTTSIVTTTSTAATISTAKSATLSTTKDATMKISNRNSSAKSSSLSTKKTHFDNAFRNNNWEALPQRSSDNRNKPNFKIPKLIKSNDSSQAKDVHKVTSKPKEVIDPPADKAIFKQPPAKDVSKNKRDNVSESSIDSQSNLKESNKSKNKNGNKSTAKKVTFNMEPATSTTVNPVSKELNEESNNGKDIEELESIPSSQAQDEQSPFNDLSEKRVEEIIAKIFQKDNNSYMIDFLAKCLGKNGFDELKNRINKVDNEGNANEDSAVSSSTPTNTVGIPTETDENKPNDLPVAVNVKKPKKKSTELEKLNEDIRTMFICNGILTATGKRMCTMYGRNETLPPKKSNPPKSKPTPSNKNESLETSKSDEPLPTLPLPPPTAGRVLRRRNTTIELVDENAIATQPAKRVTRRRDTVCEVIDTPEKGDGTQPPIKIKITTHKPTNKDKQMSIDSSTEDSETEKNSIVSNKKRTASKSETQQTKKTKSNISRQILSRECKVVLEKLDDEMPTERLTRAKKRMSENIENNIELDSETVSDAKRTKVIQNTDPTITCNSKKCVLCSAKIRFAVHHYVNQHSDQEVFCARMTQKMTDKLRNNTVEPVPIDDYKITAFCYYCEEEQSFPRSYWQSHLTSHTGEYKNFCKTCNAKSAKMDKKPKSGNCLHTNIGILNDITFGDTLHVFVCNLCNYSQIQEKNLDSHIRCAHEIKKNISKQYQKIVLIPNFLGIRSNRTSLSEKSASSESCTTLNMIADAMETTTNTLTYSEVPSNQDVFKTSEQDDGLFDDDTMKLMKENMFSDSDSPKKDNSCTMANRLSERFKKQDQIEMPKMEVDNIEIIYRGPDDESKGANRANNTKSELNTSALSSETMETISNQLDITIEEVKPDNQSEADVTKDDADDDNGWESCTGSEESGNESTVSKESETKNSNIIIANKLSRLYSKKSIGFKSNKLKKRNENKKNNCKKDKCDSSVSETSVVDAVTAGEEVTETQIESNINATKVIKRIENIGFSECSGQFEYLCFINGCSYESKKLITLLQHIRQHKEVWNGYCQQCNKQIFDQTKALFKEFTHMEEYHLPKTDDQASANIPSSESQTHPKLILKCRRFSGDKLSFIKDSSSDVPISPNLTLSLPASTQPNTATASSNFVTNLLKSPDNIIISNINNSKPFFFENPLKPWTKCNNLKSNSSVEKLLRDVSLIALYKCMAVDCIFTTGNSENMQMHLQYHEDFVSQQMANNPYVIDLDTSSWLECSYCDKMADSCNLLVTHIQTEHETSIYQCPYCFYRSVAPTNIDYHLKYYHRNKDRLILTCVGETITLVNEIESVLQCRQKNVQPIPCPFKECTQSSFILFDDFQSHLNRHIIEGVTFPCPKCELKFPKEVLMRHLNVHQIGLFQCIYCRFGCKSVDEIKIHLTNIHPTKLTYAVMRVRKNIFVSNTLTNDIELSSIVNFSNKVETDVLCSPPITERQLNFMKPELSELIHNAGDIPSDDAPSMQYQNQCRANIAIDVKRQISQSREIELKYNIRPYEDLCKKIRVLNPPTAVQQPNPPTLTILKTNAIPSTSLQIIKLTSPQSKLSMSLNQFSTGTKITTNFALPSTAMQIKKNDSLKILHVAGGVDLHDTTKSNVQSEIDLAAKSLVKGSGFSGADLYRCGFVDCTYSNADEKAFLIHFLKHQGSKYRCYHCGQTFDKPLTLKNHIKIHGIHRYFCFCCNTTAPSQSIINQHFIETHQNNQTIVYALNETRTDPLKDMFVMCPRGTKSIKEFGVKLIDRNKEKILLTKKFYLPEEASMLPQQSIFNEIVACKVCSYGSKVRANIYRHLLRGDCISNGGKPGTSTDPVNPVPCLDTGEKYFDKMRNLAASSNLSSRQQSNRFDQYIQFIPEERRFVCGAKSCHYQTQTSDMLATHINTLHELHSSYNCPHCNKDLCQNKKINTNEVLNHLQFHSSKLFKCPCCQYFHHTKGAVDKHMLLHPQNKERIILLVRQPKSLDAKQKKSIVYKWRCNVCSKATFDTRSLVKQHLQGIHQLNFQYQCMKCSFQNDIKNSVKEHIIQMHGNAESGNIKTIFERVESEIDVTPIWRRNDPYRVKHIRGILVEEEEQTVKSNDNYAEEKFNESEILDIKPVPKIINGTANCTTLNQLDDDVVHLIVLDQTETEISE